MYSFCLRLGILVVTIFAVFESCTAQFLNLYGTTGQDIAKQIIVGFDGNYLLTGSSGSTTSNRKAFVSKISPDGNVIWTKTYGGNGEDDISDIIRTKDSCYLFVGYTSSSSNGNWDGWMVKIDTSGNVLWSKTMGGGNQEFFKTALQLADSSYIIGASTASYGAGSHDAWFVKVDKSGNLVWTKTIGGSNTDYTMFGFELSGGNLLFTFYTQGVTGGYGNFDWNLIKMSPTGSTLWMKKYGSSGNEGIRDFRTTLDGNYLIIGETSTYTYGKGMVIKVDSNGNQIAENYFQANGNYHLDFYRGVETNDSGFILVGWQGNDGAILKIDKDLDPVWSKIYSETSTQFSWATNTDVNDILWVGYSNQSSGFGGSDAFFIKSDSLGKFDCKSPDANISTFTPSNGAFQNGSISIGSSSGGSFSNYSMSPSSVTFQERNFNVDHDSIPLNLDGGLSSVKVCYGDSVRLDASGLATSWLWSDNSTQSYFYAKTPGTYSVYAERPYCFNRDTALVEFFDSVEISGGYDTLICHSQSHTFNVSGTGGRPAGYVYTWYDSSTNQIIGYGNSFVDTFFQETTLKVTLWDSCMAFRDSSYFKVRLKSPLQISIPSDTTICKGEFARFYASGSGGINTNYQYNWQNGWSNSDTLERSFDTTTLISVTFSDGCSIYPDTGKFWVTTRPRLELSTNQDTTICVGESVSLRAFGSGGDSSYSYLWNQGLGAGQIQIDTPITSTQYIVVVDDGCTADDDTAYMTVYVRQPLTVSERSDTTVCQGEILNISASGTGGDSTRYVFSWTSGLDTGRSISTQFDTTTEARVILTDGCTLESDTAYLTVTVRDFLAVSLPTDTTLCRGQSLLVQATASGGSNVTYSYTWSHGLGTGSSKTITPDSTTTYQVLLEDNCSIDPDSSTITITLRAPLDVSTRSDTTICRGESVYLYSNGAGGNSSTYSFTWDNGIGSNQSPSIAPSHTTTYRVILEDNCTTAADTGYVTIFVRDSLSVVLPSDTTLCRGETYSLRANSYGGLLASHALSWNQGLGGDSTHSITPNYTTFYQVILSDNCTLIDDTASIIVSVRDSLSITPRSDTTLCKGESVWLNASPSGGLSSNYTITWNHGLGIGQQKQVSPDSTITYMVILTDNCTVIPDTGYVTVSVRPALVLSARTDTTICVGESVLLHTQSSGGYAPQHEYDWNNGVGTGNYLTVSPASSTRYRVILKDYCTVESDTDFVDILVRNPLATIPRSDTIICIGENVNLWANGLGGDSSRYQFTWDQGLDTGRSLIITPDTTTTYQLILSDACTIKNDTNTVTIFVRPPLEITERGDTFICVGEPVRLYASGTGGYALKYRYDWDSGLDTGQMNVVTPPISTTYRVILSDGCTLKEDTGYVTVFVRSPLTLIKRSDSTICKGEEVELYFDGTGGDSLHYTFIWNNLGGTGNYRKVTPDTTTNYTVHLTDNCTLASGIDSVEITVRPPLSIEARADSILCVGEGILLSAFSSGGYSPNYELDWNQGIGISNNPMVFPDTTTDYQVILRDYCTIASDTDFVHISVRAPLHAIPRLDTMICIGEPASLYAQGTGGLDTNFTFIWDHGLDTGQLNVVYPDTTTDYFVILTDACTVDPDTASLRIFVRLPLEVIPRMDSTICIGESVGLYANGNGGDSSYYYRWDQGTDTINEPNVSPVITTAYQVIIRDECTIDADTGYLTIYVRSPLEVTARLDTLICRGERVLLYAATTGGDSLSYQYEWDAGIGNAETSLATPDSTKTYRVIVRDFCTSENDTDYVTILTRDALSIAPRSDTSICMGQSVDIYGVSSGGLFSGYSFTWNQGLNNAEVHRVSPTNSTVYQVILNDGCTVISDTANFQVRVREPLDIEVRPDTFICQGESVILNTNTSGGDSLNYSYTWNQGIGAVTNPTVSPTANTNYFVTVTDNCTSLSDTGSVNIDLPIPLQIQKSNDTLVCRNDPVFMKVSGTGGLSNQYIFSWTGLGVGAVQKVSPAETSTYPVELADQCANPISDSIKVNVQIPLIPGFEYNPEWACLPNDIEFSDTTTGSLDCWFNWEFGDGSSDSAGQNLAQLNHSFDLVGTYQVRLILRSPLGCYDTSEYYPYVVHEDPIASFRHEQVDNSGIDMLVQFTSTSKGGQDYYWDYGDMQIDELIENPSHAYDTAILYQVILTVINEWGCVDSTMDTIDVKDTYRVFVPNAFTPGNLDNLNESFGPIGTGIQSFSLMVFNRWGERIFETESSEYWTGVNQLSNEPAPIGYYTYIMVIYSTREIKKTVKGSVYIVK